jgi:DNA-binding CsgD family transcriptional regulator
MSRIAARTLPCTWGMRDLSPRQREILALVAAGRTSKEIAGELGISESTVNWHISNVFERLGASSRAEAVATALREDAQLPDDPAPAKRATSPPLPMSTETIAIAVALTLVIGLLGGALIAGWNVAPPTSPSSSAAPNNRAPQSAEPTARPTGVLAPKLESTTEPTAQTPAVVQTTIAPTLPGIAPVLPAIAPTSLPVASPLPGGPALPTLLPLPSVPLLPAAPMTGR